MSAMRRHAVCTKRSLPAKEEKTNPQKQRVLSHTLLFLLPLQMSTPMLTIKSQTYITFAKIRSNLNYGKFWTFYKEGKREMRINTN